MYHAKTSVHFANGKKLLTKYDYLGSIRTSSLLEGVTYIQLMVFKW